MARCRVLIGAGVTSASCRAWHAVIPGDWDQANWGYTGTVALEMTDVPHGEPWLPSEIIEIRRRRATEAPCIECLRPIRKVKRSDRGWRCIDCAVRRSTLMVRLQRSLGALTNDQLAALQSGIDKSVAARR